jgi:hypothetical protein
MKKWVVRITAIKLVSVSLVMELPLSAATGQKSFWELGVQWTSADLHGRRCRNRWLCSVVRIIFLIAAIADMTVAQAQSMQNIAVTCIGTKNVSADALATLCQSLQQALVAKYPNEGFVLSDGTADQSAPIVTLEAFALNNSIIEARLNWQLNGESRAVGPRMGFSVTDADMTPQMQQKFLVGLLNQSALPL